VLLRLDDTHARAIFDVHRSQLLADRALSARDLAELSGAADIAFPADLSEDDPVAASMMARERVIFRNRRDLLQRQLDVIDQRIEQSLAQERGARLQLPRRKRRRPARPSARKRPRRTSGPIHQPAAPCRGGRRADGSRCVPTPQRAAAARRAGATL
jgi:hypothetical protein